MMKVGEIMRRTPTYDWKWFEKHAPFKKILEETCGLEITKYIKKKSVIAGSWTFWNHYVIKFNFSTFTENFEEVKEKLLKTNICRKNKEIFDWINNLKCSKHDIGMVIVDGCIANTSGSFEWNWGEDESNKSKSTEKGSE